MLLAPVSCRARAPRGGDDAWGIGRGSSSYSLAPSNMGNRLRLFEDEPPYISSRACSYGNGVPPLNSGATYSCSVCDQRHSLSLCLQGASESQYQHVSSRLLVGIASCSAPRLGTASCFCLFVEIVSSTIAFPGLVSFLALSSISPGASRTGGAPGLPARYLVSA